MQRDMDMIRQLLLRIEKDPQLDGHNWVHFSPNELGMNTRTEEDVGYNLTLLVEAGFVLGKTGMETIPVVSKLTWQGHEFLDNIKNDDVWSKTKSRIGGLANVSLKIVAAIAEAEIKQKLGLH